MEPLDSSVPRQNSVNDNIVTPKEAQESIKAGVGSPTFVTGTLTEAFFGAQPTQTSPVVNEFNVGNESHSQQDLLHGFSHTEAGEHHGHKHAKQIAPQTEGSSTSTQPSAEPAVQTPAASPATSAAPAAAVSPATSANLVFVSAASLGISGSANANTNPGPNDPKVTINYNSNAARTYLIQSNGGGSSTFTLQPGQTTTLAPAAGWGGAITDNNGARQEMSFANGKLFYDTDYEMGINDSTIAPEGGGTTQGETDVASKVNAAWQQLDPATQKSLFAEGMITTDNGQPNGKVIGVTTDKAESQDYRSFLQNTVKLNGYTAWNDDKNTTEDMTNNSMVINSYT